MDGAKSPSHLPHHLSCHVPDKPRLLQSTCGFGVSPGLHLCGPDHTRKDPRQDRNILFRGRRQECPSDDLDLRHGRCLRRQRQGDRQRRSHGQPDFKDLARKAYPGRTIPCGMLHLNVHRDQRGHRRRPSSNRGGNSSTSWNISTDDHCPDCRRCLFRGQSLIYLRHHNRRDHHSRLLHGGQVQSQHLDSGASRPGCRCNLCDYWLEPGCQPTDRGNQLLEAAPLPDSNSPGHHGYQCLDRAHSRIGPMCRDRA